MNLLFFILPTILLLHTANLRLANDLNTVRELKSCDSETECADGEVCVNASGLCTSDCSGLCAPQIICSCEELCDEGQTCAETTGGPTTYTTCFQDGDLDALSAIAKPLDCSDLVANGGDGEVPDNSGVCIGADLLRDLKAHELLLEKHVLASVLCDIAENCATHGHIVKYKGVGMMMRSYCKIVGCRDRVVLVNSPRYQLGLKIMSRSEDLHFTPFAARFGTSAEEAVLTTAVRLGL